MLNQQTEKSLTWLLAIGTVFVTCFVWTGNVTDPVNAPKLLAIGVLAFGVLGIVLKFGLPLLWAQSRQFAIVVAMFLFLLLTSTLFSGAPFLQSLYGAYGRNTGALTYFSLAIISLGAAQLRREESFSRITKSIVAAGLLNVVYCIWVLSFGDPIPWNNTYKKILGLLGNPDFISAFLGITIAASLGFAFKRNIKMQLRISLFVFIAISAFLIYKSHSIQGIFVALAGGAVVLFFLVRDRFENVRIHVVYVIIVAMGATLAIAGMLQHGPLSFIYKKSVSLRGSYWKAGLNMGQSHPFTGVGLDSYGDFYRSARPPIALIDTPGPTVLSNVSHNVVIDVFASGGYPLLVAYLALISLGARAVFRLVKLHRKYDVTAVVLSASWVGYQAQSIVSINQIGLAIWGWVLTGLLVGYEKVSTSKKKTEDLQQDSKASAKKIAKPQIISPQLVVGVGMAIGAILAVPPMSSDGRWFMATQSKDINTFKSALVGSYLNPTNSPRLANASLILQNSNFLADARQVALEGIKFNPNYFESYWMLYGLSSASASEKEMAMANMKRLDPNNPDVLKRQ